MITESIRKGDTVTVTFDGPGSRSEAARHARRYTTSIVATREGVKHVRHSRLVFAGTFGNDYRYNLIPV